MATGGKPSTWFPPGGLVEQDTLLKNSIQTNPFHHEEEQKEFRNKGINKTNNWKRTQPKTLFPKNVAEKMHHEIMKKKSSDVKRFTIKQKDWRNKSKIIKSLLRNKKKGFTKKNKNQDKSTKTADPSIYHSTPNAWSFWATVIFRNFLSLSRSLQQTETKQRKNQ